MTPTRTRCTRPSHRRGFTLIEILGVIAAIAILAAVLFPVFARSRERARQSSCAMNLLNIGLALRTYAAEHDDMLPPVENDMGPLHPKYVQVGQVFSCPSESQSNRKMGFPLPDPPEPEPMDPDDMAPPDDVTPSDGGMPPGMGDGMGGPGGSGPPPPSGPPGGPTGVIVPSQEMMGPVDAYADLLLTGYFYRAGRHLSSSPARWLCSDVEPNHNDGANVLFTDGAIKWIPGVQWNGMGFPSARPFEGSSGPIDYFDMGGPPPGPPPSPPGGG